MKNLHEDELFSSLERRLREYTEQPDDPVWLRIQNTMKATAPAPWTRWSDRTGLALSAVALLLAFLPFNGINDLSSANTGEPKGVVGETRERDAHERAVEVKDNEADGLNQVYAKGPEGGYQSLTGNNPADVETAAVQHHRAEDVNKETKEIKEIKGATSAHPHSLALASRTESGMPPMLKQHAVDTASTTERGEGVSVIPKNVIARGGAPRHRVVSSLPHNGVATAAEETTHAAATPVEQINIRNIREDAASQSPVQLAAEENSNAMREPVNSETLTGNTRADVSMPDTSNSILVEAAATDSIIVKDLLPQQDKRIRSLRMLSIYGSITPALSYWHLTPRANDDVVVNALEGRPIFSGERLGTSIDVGIQGQLATRLEFTVGLQLYHQNQTLVYKRQSDKVTVEPNDDMDYVVRPVIERASVPYKMLNAGVQGSLMYSLKEGVLSHKLGAGLSYQTGLLRAGGEASYNNAKSVYAAYQVFYRNEYTLNNVWRVFFQPSFSRVFYHSEKLDAPFALKASRAGFTIGLVYQLNHRP